MSNSYKKEEIETAINLLRENGYVVKKLTVGQLEDAKENYEELLEKCRYYLSHDKIQLG